MVQLIHAFFCVDNATNKTDDADMLENCPTSVRASMNEYAL